MSDLNQCNFIGRLGQDPDVRFTQQGKAVANISIAVSETWKDKQTGQKQEQVEWVKVVMFERLAEIVQQYLKKGDQIQITGKLKTRKWQDQNGQDRYSTEIIGNSLQMLGSVDQNQNNSQGQYPNQNQNQNQGGYQQNQNNQNKQQNQGRQQRQQPSRNQQQPNPHDDRQQSQSTQQQSQSVNHQTHAASNQSDDFDQDIPF